MAEDGRAAVRQAIGSTGQSPEAGTARRLTELAREMQADLTDEALLQRIVTAAVTEIHGAQHAGITLVAGKDLSTPAATGELVIQVDRIQYATGQGPCLDAARRNETVRCDDMRAESRWPLFAARTAALGVLSMLSFQLFVQDDTFGALNIYSAAAGAFGHSSESTGMLLASQGALGVTGGRCE